MKFFYIIFSLLFLTSIFSNCFLFTGEPLLEDPCIEVHEAYPDVSEDSCLWVRNVMRNHQPPNILPAATDTGGRLLAARILTDTGEILFVSGILPQFRWGILSSDCGAQGRGRLSDDVYEISGRYCARPPVDLNGYELSFFLDENFKIYQDSIGRNRMLRLTIETVSQQQQEYELLDESDFTLISINQDTTIRSLSGQFLAILHNRIDSTDRIELDSGRFDVTY